jgi:hypothetical protein
MKTIYFSVSLYYHEIRKSKVVIKGMKRLTLNSQKLFDRESGSLIVWSALDVLLNGGYTIKPL